MTTQGDINTDDGKDVTLPLQQQQQQQPPNMPPMRNGMAPETRQAMLEWEIDALRREIADLRGSLDELNNDKDRFMKWGIMALGAAVVGMGTFIFNFVFSHIK